MELKNKYKKALNKFLEEEKNKKEIIGIFVTGSYTQNCLKNNSDLDIFIVTSNKTMQILAKYYDEIEFECCYKPIEQYFYDLQILKNDIDVQRYSKGVILFDSTGDLKNMIELANILYNQGPKREITDSDLYHLEDTFKDLEDTIMLNISGLIIFKCFEKLLKIYFKKMNLWECKDKYYYEYIKKYDKKFSIMVKKFLDEKNINKKYEILNLMKDYVLKDINKLNKYWKTNEIIAPVFKNKNV